MIDRSTAHVFGKSYHRRAGGSVPNTSKTIASFQGVRCEALTMIGLDNDGDFLLELAKGGIGNRYVARTESASTQVSFCLFMTTEREPVSWFRVQAHCWTKRPYWAK